MTTIPNTSSFQTRRRFLKTQAAGLAAAAMCSTFNPLQSMTSYANSPNERPKIGFIGCGGKGFGDATELACFGDIVALSDVDTVRTEQFRNTEKICPKPNEVFTSQDYRKVLERDDIDVVGISTPDHWHVKMAIEALQAGKHVFCQKPLTLTIEESKLIRRAEKKYGKVFQVGSQQRADKEHFVLATLMIRKGLIGDVKRVTTTMTTGPKGGPFPVAPIPESFDWNMFLGQAPYVDFRVERGEGLFRYWYEYSGGKFTDWGAHHIDCALWAMDLLGPGKGPVEVDGRGVEHACPFDDKGMPTVDDCYNTPVHFNVKMKLSNGVELIVNDSDYNGILFEGTEGRIFVDRARITGKPIEENRQKVITEDDYLEINKGKPVVWHIRNFFQCIREGGQPSSDVYSHTYAMHACHLCGIAARLNRIVRWDPAKETIVGDDLAASFMSREQRKGFELPTV